MSELESLVDEPSAAALVRFGDELPASALVVVESRSASFAAIVASALGRRLAPVGDVREFAPESDRYRVAELDALIAAASLRPQRRNVLVVAAADTLDERGCARMLRTVEEPAAPTVFLLAVADRSSLSTPMLGRAHDVVTVAGHDRSRALKVARDAGLGPDEAARLVELVEPRGELAGLLCDTSMAHDELLGHLEALCALSCDAGVDELVAANAALKSLGDAVRPAVRGELGRDLVRVVLERHGDAARAKLRGGDREALSLVAACERAHALLVRYAPPAVALASVVSRERAA